MNKIAEHTIVQAIAYLLSRFNELDKLKIVKLLYLADKYHLLHYGRTITRDEYYAMRRGPVGSATKNILSFDEKNVFPETIKYTQSIIFAVDEVFQIKNRNIKFNMLSESDKESLEYIIKKFGGNTYYELYNYTHKYPEWKKHEAFLKENPNARKKITTPDLFSVIDDKLDVTSDQAKEAKMAFTDC